MADKEEEEGSLNLLNDTADRPPTEVNQVDNEPLKVTATADVNLSGNDGQQTILKDKTKIDILLKATGNAPIMKKKKWAVNPDQHIGMISEFVKKYLKVDSNEKLFLYVNQTFAPAPDQTIRNLYDCYGTDGKLIIHYCKSQAWG